MAHEIESEFVNNWSNEATKCRHCISFEGDSELGFCSEARGEVPATSHCDFFQSKDRE